jgi:hypothetical protein
MLPIAHARLPHSTQELADAIVHGLTAYGVTPREVRCEGGVWPEVATLRVDLSGARLSRTLQLPRASGPIAPALRVHAIDVVGAPLFFENAPLQLRLHASDVGLGLVQPENAAAMLGFAHVAQGEVGVEAKHADLETLAHTLVSEAAGQHGTQIKSTRLTLASIAARALRFEVEVTAKVFVMTAKVIVRGELHVDDHFNARLHKLACQGDGMMASAATALIQPRLVALEKEVIPLLALPLGQTRLHDMSIAVGETVRISARFGA